MLIETIHVASKLAAQQQKTYMVSYLNYMPKVLIGACMTLRCMMQTCFGRSFIVQIYMKVVHCLRVSTAISDTEADASRERIWRKRLIVISASWQDFQRPLAHLLELRVLMCPQIAAFTQKKKKKICITWSHLAFEMQASKYTLINI